jgi:hypothetical protein
MNNNDLIEQLSGELSRRNIDYIAHWVGNDTEKFRQLTEILFNEKPAMQMRAAWAISAVCDKFPGLFNPYTHKIISNITKFNHTGTRRLLLRHLATIEIPERHQGKLYDNCFNWLLSKDEPPAVKVHCMQILVNIAAKLPDLKREIRLVIEELTDHESPAIRSRSKELIKSL